MKLLSKVMLLSLVLLVPATAWAADESMIKWTFVEAGYVDLDADTGNLVDSKADGWFVGGSFGWKMLHFFADYQDTSGKDYDQTAYDIGVGWNGLLGDKADLYFDVAYTNEEFELTSGIPTPASSNKVDESGYFVRGGARWRPIKLFELEGNIFYADVVDSNTGYFLQGMFHIWRVGIGANWTSVSSNDTIGVFARFNFM